MARVEVGGVEREISLQLTPEAKRRTITSWFMPGLPST